MNTKVLIGADAEELIQNTINQHSENIQKTLAKFDGRSAIDAWIEVLRGIEELINVPLFGLNDAAQRRDLMNLRLDVLTPPQVAAVLDKLSKNFEAGVAQRFLHTVLRTAAIGMAMRSTGQQAGEQLRTVCGAVGYFQSRRRQMVALLYCMPRACKGSYALPPLDAINHFQPLVESCVALTGLYTQLALLKTHKDFSLNVGAEGFESNYSLELLDGFFLEPERAGLTEVPLENTDINTLKYRLDVDTKRVFSVPELLNDLLVIESKYAEFELGKTSFAQVAHFIVNCAQRACDDYHIEIPADELRDLIRLCNLPASAQQRLVYAGTGYVHAINSFAPFIHIEKKCITTVALLSRFAYNWASFCLNKIKRFQIRSGFVFENQVQSALFKQGFKITETKRIDRKEFDVVATRNGIIYNIQCKNNLVDYSRIEEDPTLFARYNKRLDRYYASALRKEEEREELLKQKLGLKDVRHSVLSKFPVSTKNPRVLAFREIDQFSERFVY